jgi:hypothetical protein
LEALQVACKPEVIKCFLLAAVAFRLSLLEREASLSFTQEKFDFPPKLTGGSQCSLMNFAAIES